MARYQKENQNLNNHIEKDKIYLFLSAIIFDNSIVDKEVNEENKQTNKKKQTSFIGICLLVIAVIVVL